MRLWIRLPKKILFQYLQGQSQAGATLNKLLSFCKHYRLYFQTTYVCSPTHTCKQILYIYMYMYNCVHEGEAQLVHIHSPCIKVERFSFFRPWKPEAKMHSQITWPLIINSLLLEKWWLFPKPQNCVQMQSVCGCVYAHFLLAKWTMKSWFFTLDSCPETVFRVTTTDRTGSHAKRNHRQHRFTCKEKLFFFN